jgi:hypothetical protein
MKVKHQEDSQKLKASHEEELKRIEAEAKNRAKVENLFTQQSTDSHSLPGSK